MELAKVLRDSYSVIYCPLMEPFGIVSIEAQASGTPVLGRDEGGIKETLLNGIGGYRLLDNPNDYAKKINEWLKSPSEYEKIYQQAREHALKNWDKKTLMNKTKRRIEGILENK
jgi:glycosyltransferase involved in cell wall biosynthesis